MNKQEMFIKSVCAGLMNRNFIGTFVASIFAKTTHVNINSLELVNKKLDNEILHIFILSIFCGVMMCLAIDNYYLFVMVIGNGIGAKLFSLKP